MSVTLYHYGSPLSVLHTVVREYVHDHVTNTGLSGREARNVFRHGGKELRTTVSDRKVSDIPTRSRNYSRTAV